MLDLNKKIEMLKLNEAKADEQRLVDFAGTELAKRFLAIRPRLKSPENDLYYWIKNKSIAELEQRITSLEQTKTNRQAKQDISSGAKLVCETPNWKVYHITTFEASQHYGRDTKWCITGINDYGDRFWKDYHEAKGADFYFLIAKKDYDPRGTSSKFAIAIYDDTSCEVFDQQDNKVTLEDIPYIDEINIPGINLSSLDSGPIYYCTDCGERIVSDFDLYIGTDGMPYCEYCFNDTFFMCDECGEIRNQFEDMIALPNGDFICKYCFDKSDYFFCDSCYEVFHKNKLIKDNNGSLLCPQCVKKYNTSNKLDIEFKGDIEKPSSIIDEFKDYENLWQ
jgi:hypothetical protein